MLKLFLKLNSKASHSHEKKKIKIIRKLIDLLKTYIFLNKITIWSEAMKSIRYCDWKLFFILFLVYIFYVI